MLLRHGRVRANSVSSTLSDECRESIATAGITQVDALVANCVSMQECSIDGLAFGEAGRGVSMSFSLIIPCYNEVANLPLLLERCKELTRDTCTEVVLVDNGSTDATSAFLQEVLPSYSSCRSVRMGVNRGYGSGILCGLAAAKSELLGWTHADLQTDPRDAIRGLELFQKHGDDIFVKGCRYGRSMMDIAMTVGMSAIESILLSRPLWDFSSQPTMFSRRFFGTWGKVLPQDFSLDLYAYYSARCRGLAIHRFPVRFGKRMHGASRWNTSWRAEWTFVRRTIDFSRELKKEFEA